MLFFSFLKSFTGESGQDVSCELCVCVCVCVCVCMCVSYSAVSNTL